MVAQLSIPRDVACWSCGEPIAERQQAHRVKARWEHVSCPRREALTAGERLDELKAVMRDWADSSADRGADERMTGKLFRSIRGWRAAEKGERK
jgi:hypothetical protein